MLDKIIFVNPNKVVLIFTHRQPFTVHTDNNTALALASYLLERNITVDFPTFVKGHFTSQEQTALTLIPRVANDQ